MARLARLVLLGTVLLAASLTVQGQGRQGQDAPYPDSRTRR